MAIKQMSVESEMTFSVAALICFKLRTWPNNRTMDALIFKEIRYKSNTFYTYITNN